MAEEPMAAVVCDTGIMRCASYNKQSATELDMKSYSSSCFSFSLPRCTR